MDTIGLNYEITIHNSSVYRIVRKLGQFANERLVHLISRPFEESPTAAEEECVSRKHGGRVAVAREEVAYVAGGVARRGHARYLEPADLHLVSVRDLLRQSLDAVISADHG